MALTAAVLGKVHEQRLGESGGGLELVPDETGGEHETDGAAGELLESQQRREDAAVQIPQSLSALQRLTDSALSPHITAGDRRQGRRQAEVGLQHRGMLWNVSVPKHCKHYQKHRAGILSL